MPQSARVEESLREYNLAAEASSGERLELIARLARRCFRTPIVLISLLEQGALKLAACQGLPISARGRDVGLDRRTLANGGPLIVPDTRTDPRFSGHAFVTDRPFVRFYAGCLVLGADGQVAGVLSVCDREPAVLDEGDLIHLRDFARLVETELRLAELDRDQQALKQERESLRRAALIDPVTQLWNRHAMFELLDREFHRARREREHVALILVNITDLDATMARYGEAAGEAMMTEMAALVRAVVRRSDAVARFSRTDCMVFLGRCRMEAAVALAERMLHRAHNAAVNHAGTLLPLQISLGVAAAGPETDWTPDALVRRAQEGLAAAMVEGGSCVRVA